MPTRCAYHGTSSLLAGNNLWRQFINFTAIPLRAREIAGVSVAALVRQFGTPTFVYDAAMIRRRIADLAAFDVVRYAQKACSNLAILDLVRRQGALVDTVSAGEIRRALAAGYAAGGDPPPIVYTADIFDAESLDLCVEHNIHVNCGSPDMIDQFGGRAPGRHITLRINPGFGHGHSQKTNTGGKQSKHGIWHGQIAECLHRADCYRSDGHRPAHAHRLRHRSGASFAGLRGDGTGGRSKSGPSLVSISVGGGLPTVYRAHRLATSIWRPISPAVMPCGGGLQDRFGHALRLEIEPGRYLVAESGYLVAEIRAVKRQDDNTFYLLDAGFNNLARPILYGAYHPMSIVPADGDTRRPEQDVIVGGPLCESGDIFTQEEGGFVSTRRLPEAKVGELLVIECAGAYGFVMGSNYNSKPLAAEVLIRDGSPCLIRRRQTFDDLIRGEEIPVR